MKSGLVGALPGRAADGSANIPASGCRNPQKVEIDYRCMSAPSPYRTIAVASTFSPRFKQVLAEAKRIRDRFSSDLHLIYVGDRNEEISKKFNDALAQLQLPADSPIHYEADEAGDPAQAILRVLDRHKIDMVVAGALEKEVVLHPFLGNVARRLVREAACGVMLFTHPHAKPKPLRQIVFVADDFEHALHALKKTLALASAESCERLYVVRIITAFDKARASIRADAGDGEKSKTKDEEEDALERFVLSAGATEVPIEARCIRGNTGLAASDFVQSVKADLLVVPLQKNDGAIQQLPSNIAWITDVIPCNLWVIR
jgi:nucleotide-binding universal stress UspA family protein